MKKFFKTLSIIAGTLLIASSCSEKLLDIPQQGVQSEDNSYITDDDCLSAITSVYSGWRSVWSGCGYNIGVVYSNMFWLKNLLADDMTTGSTFQSELSYSTVTSTNPWVEAVYNGLYKTLYYANIVTDKFTDESPAKARCIAEAKFFKGLCYYELITLWGEVPLVDHVLAPEEYQIGPSTTSELWAFVEKMLNEAIDSGTLPSKTNIDDKDTGTRITKEAAYAVLGKVYLTEEKFSDAQTAFQKVISSGLTFTVRRTESSFESSLTE